MLLFNHCWAWATFEAEHISIHLMLLFNMNRILNGYGGKAISIHLMLLFNLFKFFFQFHDFHFNTSNVTIQLVFAFNHCIAAVFQYI